MGALCPWHLWRSTSLPIVVTGGVLGEVSVFGWGDEELGRFATPALSTVAMARLIAKVRGEPAPEPAARSINPGHRSRDGRPATPGGPKAPPEYVWDGDGNSHVWTAKAAQEYGVERFFAVPWSPTRTPRSVLGGAVTFPSRAPTTIVLR
ncbi:hypothetical protein [Nonomuraea jabiensis]|uniref:Uncharacterized protein n=1 Tax=Nonomuraea jabiensis TaxID=882448 RepID=A0A7W9GCZ7_9ACTN|nr:hypothetical protein [Nonomuraea jabiensis]MBB5781517.1 hypothetical protein [Nonomuraea jabiensis]